MTSSLPSITSSPVTTENILKEEGRLRKSWSSKGLARRAGIRRTYSDNNLCCRVSRIHASTIEPKLKSSSSSVGFFNVQLSRTMIPDTLKSLLFELESSKEINIEEKLVEREDEIDVEKVKKRANWIERLMEIRNNWKEKQQKENVNVVGENNEGCDEDGGCDVDYDDDAEGKEINIDSKLFSSLLSHVSWADTRLFSRLAFLCNMAYVIPDIKTRDLSRYYGLDLVTSSLEKKAQAEVIKDKPEKDSTSVPRIMSKKNRLRSSAAYEIAASAAFYVQSRTKNIEDDHQEEEKETSSPRVFKSEMAASVAASTMTTVIAANEKQKQETARDLQSLHSSPCEWFVCDDSSIYTRCFVIQGSDSVESWQANLFFDPTKFEGTDVLVHRGIYEAAKGIYEQFMPEIMQHLNRFGDRAKLQFTGHSLGGSLALLVNLMLLTRKVVKPSALLPVVTFGSPFVFCGGQKILDELGLDENHVHCVMMHRDIVPRAFSCNYPNYVAQVLKRLSGTFRSHPCLNKNKLLYSPMGKFFILQPDEKSSPPHPLLPTGSALYAFDSTNCSLTKSAFRAFLNSPHPLETLSYPTAYGSEGTIIRDHDSSNYLKAVNEVIRHARLVERKASKQTNQLWPLLTSQSPHMWSHKHNMGVRTVTEEILTGA
ncbi:alpha/beta-Hydrolases superfamily protein [Abeliophyllum distichum]|uniref:Alpha/beta-Hydrolases superfamily protein n=1 Tax=Abeliophyllum distichum TaxID=126358 RepID=A0ABD1PC69_9LAMI